MPNQEEAALPRYVGHGVDMIHVLKGSCAIPLWQARSAARERLEGRLEGRLEEGDSLSIDAELTHGVTDVLTPEFIFLSIQA